MMNKISKFRIKTGFVLLIFPFAAGSNMDHSTGSNPAYIAFNYYFS